MQVGSRYFLGRELLELYTLTPKSGYTQSDIVNAAKLFSGLRVKWPERWYQRGPRQRPWGSTFVDVPPYSTMLHGERQNYGTFKIMGWQQTITKIDQVLPHGRCLGPLWYQRSGHLPRNPENSFAALTISDWV